MQFVMVRCLLAGILLIFITTSVFGQVPVVMCVEFEESDCASHESDCRPNINCSLFGPNPNICDKAWLAAGADPILFQVGNDNPEGTSGWDAYHLGYIPCGLNFDCSCGISWNFAVPESKCNVYHPKSPWEWPDWVLARECTPSPIE